MKKRKLLMGLGALILCASCTTPNPSTSSSSNSNNSSSSSSSSSVDSPTSTSSSSIDLSELESVKDLELDAERKYTGTVKDVDGTKVPHGEGLLTWVSTNCTYEGGFVDGLYEGEGTFSWLSIGDTLVGTFKAGAPVYGKYTYSNTMSYTGEFNANWQYHGTGSFDWNTYNAKGQVLNYGWLYEGEFVNGSPAGCKGKITFTGVRMNELAEGVHWFEGELNAFPGLTPNQSGKGKIKYGDGTYYVGDIYYTGSDYLRIGNGVQYYDLMQINASDYGGPAGEYMYKIEGQFDHNVTGWMYGNCVIYLTDRNGNPTSYMKGFWNGANRTGEWDDELSTFKLDERWKNAKLVEYDRFGARVEHYQNMYKDKTSTDVLYIGDSYMEMWRKEYNLSDYETQMKDYDTVNTAIGGTTAADWMGWIDEAVTPYNADKIVVHLGINDVNLGLTNVSNRLIQLLEAIHEANPNAQIYYCSIEPSILFKQNWNKAKASNTALKTYCESKDYLTYLDTASLFINSDGSFKTSYYCMDNIHPSTEGYQALTTYINQQVGLVD